MPAARPTRSPRRADDQGLLKRLDSNKWLLTLAVGGLVNTGIMYQQFTYIKEKLGESISEQRSLNSKLSEVQLKQVGGLAAIETLKATDQSLDSRLTKIETMLMDSRQAPRK